ncbi:DUF2059 domain-containing protein [Massilia sp. R2A-15]|uniref:DUF2059 domain-containing protein n=1 Tax=Massilia sp. R2A-15 TaxID=3064278 RepID=UPI002736DC1A|nr:DUF2059 domain-containing protein [Massilia sp. R2A-15]WLI90168.1 DUF2059 domain-containing protein [Massilia sp. R2A-15]
MKKIVLAACLALSFAVPSVYAQKAAPVDPATAAAARELLESMNYRATMKAMMTQMQQNMPAVMLQGATAAIEGNPKLTAEQKAAEIKKAREEIPKASASFGATFSDPALMDELANEMVPLYARHYTVDELHQMAAFYRSPVGVKMMATMPEVMGESMVISQKVMMPRIKAAIAKVVKTQ